MNYNVGVAGSVCIGILYMIIIAVVVLKLLKVITCSWVYEFTMILGTFGVVAIFYIIENKY